MITSIEYTKKQKDEIILEYIKNKTVLDIGCINHDYRCEKDPNWIHKIIKNNSKKTIGIDYLKKDAEILNKKGYDIRIANAEDFHFSEKFDVIIAGDIIEHLNNPGMFLDRINEHLKNNGTVIISTPNPFSVFSFISYLTRETYTNEEHTAWYCRKTMERILKNKGFIIQKIYYHNWKSFYDMKSKKYINFKSFYIYHLICKMIPKIANNHVFIVKKR